MTPQDMEAIRALRDEMHMIAIVAGQCSVEGPENTASLMAAAEADRCSKWASRLDTLLSSLTAAGGGEDTRQVAAEMRHFGRLLRSRDVIPTPDTMADRLTEWAEELFGAQPSPADGKAQEPV